MGGGSSGERGRGKGKKGKRGGRNRGKGSEKGERGERVGRKRREEEERKGEEKGEKGRGEGRKRDVEKEAGASGAVRIRISLLPLKSYIKAVRLLYSEFDVHSSILGSSNSRDISTIIASLADTENYLTV